MNFLLDRPSMSSSTSIELYNQASSPYQTTKPINRKTKKKKKKKKMSPYLVRTFKSKVNCVTWIEHSFDSYLRPLLTRHDPPLHLPLKVGRKDLAPVYTVPRNGSRNARWEKLRRRIYLNGNKSEDWSMAQIPGCPSTKRYKKVARVHRRLVFARGGNRRCAMVGKK